MLHSQDERDQGDKKVLSSEGHTEEVGQLSIISTYRGTLLLSQGDNLLDLPKSPPQINLHLRASIHNNQIEIKAIDQFKDSFIPIIGNGSSKENIFVFENALGKLAINGGWLFVRATGGVVIEGENICRMEFDYHISNGISSYQFYGFEQ